MTDTWTSTRPRGSDAATHPARAGLAEPGSIDSIVAWLLDPRAGGTRGRISRSVLGWLPIALAIGWIVGELSGCGRFSATCDPSVGPLTAAGQAIVLGALFLIPEVAALAAGAAIVVAVAAVAATFILSATGAAADETSRRAALGALLLVAWLTGLVLALVRRVRAGPRDSPRGGRPVS